MSDMSRWTDLQQEYEQARAERDTAWQLLDAALPVCEALIAHAVTFNEVLAAELLTRQIKVVRR